MGCGCGCGGYLEAQAVDTAPLVDDVLVKGPVLHTGAGVGGAGVGDGNTRVGRVRTTYLDEQRQAFDAAGDGREDAGH
jgi:hypothetical protein